MRTFGDRLKEAREDRGVRLDDIANGTRIARRYLEALERGDVGALPGGAFNRGYIRSYAQFLDLDPSPFLEAYAAEENAGKETAEEAQRMLADFRRLVERRAPKHRGRGPGRPFVVASAALLVCLGLLFWKLGRNENVEPTAPSTHETSTRREVEEPSPAVAVETTPSSEQQPQSSEVSASTSLSVPSHGVGTAVVERNLVGRGERFQEGTEVWFWTRVVGGEPGEIIRHVWMREGRVVMSAQLEVGGPHWRTYTRVLLPPDAHGRWAVEARSANGEILARDEFFCVPSPEPPSPTP